jgi:hypothetical protein
MLAFAAEIKCQFHNLYFQYIASLTGIVTQMIV